MRTGTTYPLSLPVRPTEPRLTSTLCGYNLTMQGVKASAGSAAAPLTGMALASLAILKVNADEGRDYVDGFVPFATECLRQAPQAEVALEDLETCMRAEFGFSIPLPALRTILHRATRDGLVSVERGVFRRVERLDLEPSKAFPAALADALRQGRAVSEHLIDYAQTRHGLSWTREEAETALFTSLQEQAVPVLAAALQGTPVVAIAAAQPKGAPFIVSAFVLELSERDPETFGYLETFMKGAMLTSVLFFPELGQILRRFGRLDAFFDTPVLLRAIGAHGPVAQRAAQQTIDLAYELGIKPLCFSSTFNETLGVLNGAARAVRRYGAYSLDPSETVQYLLAGAYSASDVELMIARLGQVLRSLRIQIVDRPEQTRQLVVDEVGFESVLQEEVHYQNPDALKHDLDALTAIHRLRGGEIHRSFETARAVFVTTNSSLTRAARGFFNDHYHGTGVPLCFTAHHFGTLLWLKKPAAAPDLPRELLMASCYAALNPPDRLWRKYLEEIDKLRNRSDLTAEDYHLLRFDLGSKSSLLALTGGSPDAFVEGTVSEVLRRARENASREAEQRYRAASERADSAEQARLAVDLRATRERQSRLLRYRLTGNKVGRAFRWSILSLGFFVAAGLATVGYLNPGNWILLILAAVAVLASAAAVLGWSFGGWVRGLAIAADARTSKLVADWLEERFEIRDL